MSGSPPDPQSKAPPIAGKLFLGVSAALLIGWLSWLSYTALTKSHAPTVSRAQAASATTGVVAELTAQGDTLPAVITVKEKLTANGPEPGQSITVKNLPIATGYTGPGEYLLLLVKGGAGEYMVVGQQRSPGAELDGIGPPMIYKWGDDVRAQVNRMFPPK